MEHLRRLIAAHRGLMLALVAGVMLARGLMPDGWMAMPGGHGGAAIVPCDGMAPAAMPGRHHHDPVDHGGDHPCAFAVGVASLTGGAEIAVAAPSPVMAAPIVARLALFPGRGLAAPPPPATGPPLHA